MSRLIRRYPVYDVESPFDLVNVADISGAPVNPLIADQVLIDIAAFFADLKARGIVPIAAGGDHGITYSIWKGLLSAREPVGVIHIDSHPETNDEIYGSRYNHGTMFTRAVEEGLVNPKRVVSVGIHGTRFIDRSEPLGPAVEALMGERGIDVVLDVTGADPIRDMWHALRRAGRYATGGAIAGPTANIDLRDLI